jgi:hypothetical protein
MSLRAMRMHSYELKGAWQSHYYYEIASATPRNDIYHSVLRNSIISNLLLSDRTNYELRTTNHEP